MLSRLARAIAGAPRAVITVGLVVVGIAFAVGGGVIDHVVPYSAKDPASESVRATERFQQASGYDADPGIVVLLDTPSGVRSVEARARVTATRAALAAHPAIVRVVGPYEPGAEAQISNDRQSVYVLAHFAPVDDETRQETAAAIQQRLAGEEWAHVGGTDTTQDQINSTAEEDLARAELITLPFVLLLALWFFRSPIAALMPPLVGLTTVALTFLGLRALTELTDVSVFALNLATGLGLGLSIDYSLFVVSRYREERARGGTGEEILQRTLRTAGRTVVVSSVTVSAALAGLLVFPQSFLRSMGFAGVMVPLLAAVATVVLLPAVLHALGPRLEAGTPRWLRARAERDSRPDRAGRWYRVAQFARRRAVPVAASTTLLLLVFGLPFLGANFIMADARVLPAQKSARVVHDRIAAEFPPAVTDGTLVVLAPGTSRAAGDALAARIARLPDVVGVGGPQAVGSGVSTIEVLPAGDPLADPAKQLVREVRAMPRPTGFEVTGITASFIDQEQSLADHLPWAIAIIAMVTSVAIFLLTGSVVLPIKTFLINVLTISAAFGLLVFVFQDGRLEGLLDYESSGALDLTQPILILALVFGLSTDYAVFLLSRIKEAREAGVPEDEAVAVGLERTGRIITAAALMFCVAVTSFALSEIVFLKEIGIGTAFAVLVDATIVRILLVPALMALLGRLNWWAPSPLVRLHGRIGISEADDLSTEPAATAGAAPP